MRSEKQLGNTGIICPPIIHGTSYLGNLYRELPEDDKMALMSEWFRVSTGRVMIDTAGKYGAGLTLEVIGKGLQKLGIEPSQITISNKLGWYRVPMTSKEPTFEPGVWANIKNDAVQKISYTGILECWQQGCELLGGNYRPESVSVHDPDEYLAAARDPVDRKNRMDDIIGAYKALFELKGKGEVKAVGIGSKDWLVIKEIYEHVKFDWVMFANKFTIFHHPRAIINFMIQLENDGVGIVNSAVFNAGFLTGGSYFDYRLANREDAAFKSLFEWRDSFFSVCTKYSVEPGDACLKFAFSAPQITALALNPGKPARMAHNLSILETDLPQDFWNALREKKLIDPEYPYL